jgi:tetraacyldisaccharide 4'-kinase
MKSLLISLLKYLSLPLTLLYGSVVWLRNKFYDWKIFSSIGFDLPVICVGNITVGGTGKSPHIEYLIELLSPYYSVATLSRGYRRRSRGFKLADSESNARDIGDEPFQFKSKYPQIAVAVAEERMTAIPLLLQQLPHLQVILLDDAFQHRTVKAGLNILLTDYDRLYTRDHIMPFGLLRESPKAAERAQIIIVSKCPPDLSLSDKQKIEQEIQSQAHQQVFFSTIAYQQLYPLTHTLIEPDAEFVVLLVTGIANPQPLKNHLQSKFSKVYSLPYKDHHYFTYDDLDEIYETFANIPESKKIMVTTEKDAGRLMLLKDKMSHQPWPLFAQKIGTAFLFKDEIPFRKQIDAFTESFYPPVVFTEVFSEAEENEDVL